MSVHKEITVVVKVNTETPARSKDKIALLKAISDLPHQDQERILTICQNPKALKGLAENWGLLQGMFS